MRALWCFRRVPIGFQGVFEEIVVYWVRWHFGKLYSFPYMVLIEVRIHKYVPGPQTYNSVIRAFAVFARVGAGSCILVEDLGWFRVQG